jgi:hypothetical protein
MNEVRKVVVYHYEREGKTFTTPSVKIAFGRKDSGILQIETLTDGVSDISNLEVLSEDSPKIIEN